ncbi:hypothetical protein TNCV_799811 [Trichonephila clavipes]|nr:hypothetical protein TNCV_799811 [Trichonephila clavipes]
MALYRSPLTVMLWPSSFLKKYGSLIPPAHKAHQTVGKTVKEKLQVGLSNLGRELVTGVADSWGRVLVSLKTTGVAYSWGQVLVSLKTSHI